MIFGTLGRKLWHRCDDCGMEFADRFVCPACGAEDEPYREDEWFDDDDD